MSDTTFYPKLILEFDNFIQKLENMEIPLDFETNELENFNELKEIIKLNRSELKAFLRFRKGIKKLEAIQEMPF